MTSTRDRTFRSVYEPIHKYRQFGEDMNQLDSVLRYIQNASNYSLYKIQQYLPGTPLVCTYDPLVWLPPELLDKLLTYLSPASCITLMRVSKSWHRYLTHHCMWHLARRRLSISDSMFQSLGCAMNDATHPSWLTVTRAAVSLYNRMRIKETFFNKEVIPIQEATGISISGPYQLTASNGLICQYAMHKWAVYDTTSKEVLSRHAAGVDNRDKITCMRFVDTSNSSKYRPEGIITYGNVMGDVFAALPLVDNTSYVERSIPLHSGAVSCCDADAELDIIVSAAADGSIAVSCLSSGHSLFTDHINFGVDEVHIFPIKDEMYNIIAYGVEKCIQFQWPAKKSEGPLPRRRYRGLLGFNLFDQSPELMKVFGDFLSFTTKELLVEDTVVVKVVHRSNSTIGCVDVSLNEKSNKILVYDAYTLNLLISAKTGLKISHFEAAGRRFALFTTTSWGLLDQSISPSFKDEALVLFDLITAQHLNYIVLPYRSVSFYSTSIRRCTTYDTLWLDELPVGAVLTADWQEVDSALPDDENMSVPSDSCSSLSSLSEEPGPSVSPEPGTSAEAYPLLYRPRPKSPILYITYTNSKVLVVTWKLAPPTKPKPHKTKQE